MTRLMQYSYVNLIIGTEVHSHHDHHSLGMR